MDERIKDGGDAEICVIGGGIAGLVFARRVRRPVLVLDGDDGGGDGKSVVIGAQTADVLAALSALPKTSRPLCRAHVSFSGGGGDAEVAPTWRKRCESAFFGGVPRTDGDTGDSDDAPFAYGIDPKAAQTALSDGVQIWKTRAASIAPAEGGKTLITAEDGKSVRAARVVVACPLPFLPPPFVTRRYAYAQSVLSLTAECEDWTEGDARQRFTRRGMVVLVPRPDGDVGIIVSAPPKVAGELNAMPDEDLSAYLSGEFNLRLRVFGRRAAYSPQLVRTRPLAAGNISLIGGGATLLHPAGAKSIDLAVADACYLAEQTAAGAAADSRPRAPAHCAAMATSSALALGAHCRALPLRLAGGALLSLFGRTPPRNSPPAFGATADGVRQ